METKTVSVRLPENIINEIKENFEGFNAGISLIVEPFDRLRRVTINELKGYFTREEIVALVDSLNGTMLTPEFIYNKQFWVIQLEDFENLENGISRHSANSKILLEKIENLSQSQVYFLLIDIHIFWNSGCDLEEYLKIKI